MDDLRDEISRVCMEADAAAQECDAYRRKAEQRQPPQIVYKTFHTPPTPAPVAAPVDDRKFALDATTALAEEIGSVTGSLEKRIATLEHQLAELNSEVTLLRAISPRSSNVTSMRDRNVA